MKNLMMTCALLLPVWVGAQECTIGQYQKLLTEADQATAKGQYELAINKLQSAKTCRPEKEAEVGRKTLVVFDKVNGERQAAIRNAEEAGRQQKIAQENAKEAQKQTAIALSEKEKAETETRRVYANDLAYKSQIAFRDGDRTTAFLLAKFGVFFVDELNVNATQAMINAFYYGKRQKKDYLYWNRNLSGHSGAVGEVSFSPKGKILATASSDNTIKIWDYEAGKSIITLVGNEDMIKCVAFSPDGSIVATGSEDGKVKTWNIASGKEIFNLNGHQDMVIGVSFSPDGRKIASVSQDTTAIIWDLSTGKSLFTLNKKSNGSYGNDIQFSPDGKWVASGSSAVYPNDNLIKFWDSTNGELLFTFKEESSGISTIAFSPDGKKLASGSRDNIARIWDIANKKILLYLKGHTAPIRRIVFSPDGKRVATGSWDKTVKVWNVETGEILFTLTGHTSDILSVAFSPDGHTIGSSSFDHEVKIWDINEVDKSMTPAKHAKLAASHFSRSSDKRKLATAKIWSNDFTATVYDIESNNKIFTLSGHTDDVWCTAFSPDNKLLATGSLDRTVKLWDMATGRLVRTLEGHSGQINHIAFSHDGSMIASASSDKTIKVWMTASGKLLNTLSGHTVNVTCIDFFPDNKRVISGSFDSTIKIWDINTGKIITTISDRGRQVSSLALSQDGNKMVCLMGMFMSIWDLTDGQERLKFEYPTGYVKNIGFSQDMESVSMIGRDFEHKWELNPLNILKVSENYSLAALTLAQLQEYKLSSLLDIRPDNESRLLATRETWQIAAFADLYAQKIAQTGFPEKADYERALRLYRACLSHNVDNGYFEKKIADLERVWKEREK